MKKPKRKKPGRAKITPPPPSLRAQRTTKADADRAYSKLLDGMFSRPSPGEMLLMEAVIGAMDKRR